MSSDGEGLVGVEGYERAASMKSAKTLSRLGEEGRWQMPMTSNLHEDWKSSHGEGM
jgi:hypothetical protein